MANSISFIIGFLSAWLANTAPQSLVFIANVLSVGLLSSFWFFPTKHIRPLPALIGLIIAQELLFTQHFGLASLFGLCYYLITLIFVEYIKLTNRLWRFTASSVCISLLCFIQMIGLEYITSLWSSIIVAALLLFIIVFPRSVIPRSYSEELLK